MRLRSGYVYSFQSSASLGSNKQASRSTKQRRKRQTTKQTSSSKLKKAEKVEITGSNLRGFENQFTVKEVEVGLKTLQKDEEFVKALNRRFRRRNESFRDKMERLFVLDLPAKYLGKELGTRQKARFGFVEQAWLRLNPRKYDNRPQGLRFSTTTKTFQAQFGIKLYQALKTEQAKEQLAVAIQNKDTFASSTYARTMKRILQPVIKETGISGAILVQVLKRGAYAYSGGRRPGMTRQGWAVARLTSFLFRGCTYYFPDHKLVLESKATKWFQNLPCLCRKKAQCCRFGQRTLANAR